MTDLTLALNHPHAGQGEGEPGVEAVNGCLEMAGVRLLPDDRLEPEPEPDVSPVPLDRVHLPMPPSRWPSPRVHYRRSHCQPVLHAEEHHAESVSVSATYRAAAKQANEAENEAMSHSALSQNCHGFCKSYYMVEP